MKRIVVGSMLMLAFFLLVTGDNRRLRKYSQIGRTGYGDGAIDLNHRWYYRNGEKHLMIDPTPEREVLQEVLRRLEEINRPQR